MVTIATLVADGADGHPGGNLGISHFARTGVNAPETMFLIWRNFGGKAAAETSSDYGGFQLEQHVHDLSDSAAAL